ncbi:hypothetical protein [Parapedobacter koreensis]|uniref:Uncharacterized protein n=1 Tax=Parapedobacter koreensis TaxID=332977 RepID=A0A1H7IWH4_9SPHI|nr:hypothetical protein [Parapedobacter koreensis]SEK66027.1 hypothetical protein SAMN05421740_102366 [Parapedobacter koreensis]
MNKKGNLFLLIRSLSKSEKRYFRIFAGMGGRDANYLQLFDVIDKQEQYDEEAVREKFKGEKFLNQLHVTKIYLTELIMKAMRNYHADSSVESTILDLIKDAELLFNKELYDLCHSRILKAEELADKYEKLPLLVEVLSWKRKLNLTISGTPPDVNAILEKESEAIEQMNILNTYWAQIMNIRTAIMDNTDIKSIKPAASGNDFTLQSKILHIHIAYTIHFFSGDTKGAIRYSTDLIELLEKFPGRIREDPHSYVTAISNKISVLLAVKRWEEIPPLIDRIREVPRKYKLEHENKFTVRLWLRTFNVELEMYRDSKEHEKGIVLMHQIQKFIAARRTAIPDDYILMFYYQFASIFFQKKAYSQSLHWLNEIINSGFGNAREDIQAYARILNLIVHFELNNIIVLRYAVDSCRRFLKKRRIDNGAVKEVLNLFSGLSRAYPTAYEPIFKKSYAKFSRSDIGQLQDFIDIKGWLEEKMKI